MKATAIRFIFCMALALFLRPAMAEYASFQDNQPLPAFDSDYLVTGGAETSATLTVTLAGDCTLGGTESSAKRAEGMVKTVAKKGLAYPFSGLLSLFSQDDLTLVNLEGVLSDERQGENTEKEFAFRGPASFTQMLAMGSVEAVNLSNNHFDDYGPAGRKATIKNLEDHGIAYAGNEWLCVYNTGRGKIGLAGIRGSLTDAKKQTVKKQIALLREAGCEIILYSLHAGQEYAQKHNGLQRDMARFLIDAGADVVAGHHPHVVQGIEIYRNRLIFYSLGNCVFGGNHNPREKDALAAQVTFSIENGRLTGLKASLHPMRFTGKGKGNSFSPVLLSGKQAEAVLDKVRLDTAFTIPPYEDGTGAQLTLIPAE